MSSIQLHKLGKIEGVKGPEDKFTGEVVLAMFLSPTEGPSSLSSADVIFEAKARTAWHQHPKGQLLVVTSGEGFVQKWGEEVQVIKPGDVVWIPPMTKHWHGACATQGMSHVATQEAKDGEYAYWMEHVSDEQYPEG